MHHRIPAEDISFCVAAARKLRAQADVQRYIEVRVARKPWLTLPEAAEALDLSQGRISQLLSQGTFRHRKSPTRAGCKEVSAADVYAYTPTPEKKTRTKTQ